MKNVTLNQQLEEHGDILRNLATKFTQDYDEIQDLVQETFDRALKHMDNFCKNPTIVWWLFVIMRNIYISQYPHRQYRRTDEQYSASKYRQMSFSEPFTEENFDK